MQESTTMTKNGTPHSAPMAASGSSGVADRPRMVMAIGTNYSGTTLLAMMMDCHPQIASVGECALNRHARERQRSGAAAPFPCSCRLPLNECPFWRSLFDRMQHLGYPLDADNWVTDYKYRNDLLNTALGVYSARGWLRSLQVLADRYLPIHRQRLKRTTQARVAFVRTVLERTGKEVFFDTTKYVLQAYQMGQSPDLDVRFLRIVRDVRSFVASSKRRGRDVDERAQNWVNFHTATEDVFASVPEDRILVIRYEDLCREPVATQRQIYAFCGVKDAPPPTVVVPQEHHVIGNTIRLKDKLEIKLVESWREELSADEQSRILRIAGAMNEKLGFSPS
jgi:Sulfotransferase family